MAIKELGFTNVKIYNGGLKDWKRSGYPLERLEPLEGHKGTYLSPEELWGKMAQAALDGSCSDSDGNPKLTIVDYRTERVIGTPEPMVSILTSCPVVLVLLDDLADPDARSKIPRTGLVVVMSETGNRDWAALAVLAKFGYTNVVGLHDGMRGWLKAGLPVEWH